LDENDPKSQKNNELAPARPPQVDAVQESTQSTGSILQPDFGGSKFTPYKGENKTMKYTIAVLLIIVAAAAGYFVLRRLTYKDLGFTPVKCYATKLAKTPIHTEATAAQEAGGA
jgi:hypothetical protein